MVKPLSWKVPDFRGVLEDEIRQRRVFPFRAATDLQLVLNAMEPDTEDMEQLEEPVLKDATNDAWQHSVERTAESQVRTVRLVSIQELWENEVKEKT